MERRSLKYYIVNIGVFFVGSNRICGVPKAVKITRINYTSSKLSIARITFFYWSSECDVLIPVVHKYEPYT